MEKPPSFSPRTTGAAIFCFLLLLFIHPAAGAPGSLDLSFGSDGKVTVDFDSSADFGTGIHVLPDGKLIVTGFSDNDFALLRLTEDGTLDTDFGTDGKVITDVAMSPQQVRDSLVTPDQKILLGGYSSSNFALIRYLSDGSLDTDFGNGGVVTTSFGAGTGAAIESIARQDDGKIVAVGTYVEHSGADNDVAVARYLDDGTLDPTFGTGGLITIDMNGFDDQFRAVIVLSNGKIMAGGTTSTAVGTLTYDHLLMRFLSDGSLDTTFGTDGVLIFDIRTDGDGIEALAQMSDGSVVSAGFAYEGTAVNTNRDFIAVKYKEDGTLDSDFGTNGIVAINFSNGDDDPNDILITGDDKIVIAGVAYSSGSRENFALTRLLTNGALDPEWGNSGISLTDIGTASIDNANSIALQPDGKIVAAGKTTPNFSTPMNFGIVRYQDVPPVYSPDCFLSRSSAASTGIGDNIVNLSAAGQLQSLKSRKARTVTTYCYVRNRGNVPDRFSTRGSGGNRYFRIYYYTDRNVTGSVLAGSLISQEMAPDQISRVRVRIKPVKKRLKRKIRRNGRKKIRWRRKSRTFRLSSGSHGDQTKIDAVAIKLKHR